MSWLGDGLRATAARCPHKIALISDAGRWTYAEALARATRLAAALHVRGVRPGDRVAMLAGNTLDGAVAFWGIAQSGAVVVPINPLIKAEKLGWLIDHCGAAAIVFERGLASLCNGLPTAVSRIELDDLDAPVGDPEIVTPGRDDLAMIIYTSGSTGRPKGVMLSHGNIDSAASAIGQYLQLTEHDVIHGFMPLSFDYGLYQLILSVGMAARLVLAPSFALPAQILKQAAVERVTVVPGVPTVFSLLATVRDPAAWDLASVRLVTSTAAALMDKHLATIARVFPRAEVCSMYGVTECKRCSYLPPAELARKPGSVGIAIPSTELWLVDDDGRRLGSGATGELVIRGPTIMQGYWRDAAATAARLRPGPAPGERVLYTGDLCRLDDDGYLYFVGRKDDIIKSRGEKVAPKEVELALMAIDGVHEAAVIGVPDDILGHAVIAYVVADAALDEPAVLRACRARLEAFMVPRSVAFVPRLPRSANGKIDKRALAGLA